MKCFPRCSVFAFFVYFDQEHPVKNKHGHRPINTFPEKFNSTLYTDKDFSDNNQLITFELSIQKTEGQVLWDSVFTPMKIKDIPGPANKWVIEKWVPGNDPSLLKTGFYYSIENVGNSWYMDSLKWGRHLKPSILISSSLPSFLISRIRRLFLYVLISRIWVCAF